MFKNKSPNQGPSKVEPTGNPLTEDLCFVVQRTCRLISRRADTTLRSTGLTSEQTYLLATIAELGSPRVSELSQALRLDHSTAIANLKPLVRQNWVTVSVDMDDRSARRLRLTGDGGERLRSALELLHEIEDAMAIAFGGTRNTRSLCHALGQLTTTSA